ncbi:MAG TPA: sterol desaturase family protein [Pirellulales bacterium]|jgi:sterol desaturase/sphingolipid hydroxylase (fatty acid hydroxylase superfamily)|nr:sterol desaturase family protein [Pirellulales bacterium]
MMLLLEFVGFFAFILVFGYLWPAGYFYYRYHWKTSAAQEPYRIQTTVPARKQICREIRLSLVTILIFAIGSTIVFEMYRAGLTRIYRPLTVGPLWYAPLSFILCVFLNDTYFYWTHRFMHWRPVFKYIHLTHHRSVAPTPWAIFAFSPWEAILQFVGLALLIVFLPLCPLVLILFLAYDTLVNIAGHTGFELVPKWISRAPVLRWFNTVTHHDAHHTNVRVNYGAFLNVWDRWMGTFLDK